MAGESTHGTRGSRTGGREAAGAACGGTNAHHFNPAAAECLREGEEKKRAPGGFRRDQFFYMPFYPGILGVGAHGFPGAWGKVSCIILQLHPSGV